MTTEMGLSVVGKIVEMMVDRIVNSVGRQCSYIFCYKRNIQTLIDELAMLEARRDGVQIRTAEAERNLEIVDPTMRLWITKADIIKGKVTEVHEGTSNVEKGCLKGWCPNLKHRYLLSRKATKLTEGICKLKVEGDKYTEFSHSALPRGIVSSEVSSISPVDDGSKGFATRIATLNEVMDVLKDDGVNLIGISGMGGVGKTTLVNQVLEKVKAERLFDEVAMSEVSQKPNLVKIQGEIAEMIGLKFTDGSSVARAERLSERLKKGGKVLVVLDDIWEAIDMDKVGIPTGNGCKVVFTTRMARACTEMKAQRHVMVKVLSDLEAWDLFRDVAGDCVENADLRDIAKEVAKECGGLPIAVVTLGKALSGREKYEWEDTMLMLKKSSGMDERVQSCILLSYNFLESRRPQAQSLLLLCTLFQEDENIPIELLVEYSMGIDLFDDVETFEETRNRVHSLVSCLKSCNLLLPGDQEVDIFSVKFHDVVRDVCLLIASKPPHSYLVRHDLKLKQWPQNNRQQAHIAIALESDEINEIPGGLDCPNLRLLQLHLKHENININSEFFRGIRGLGVLSFNGKINGYGPMPISGLFLPPTLRLLTNLQTLSLEFCDLGGDVSSIGCLKGLKILSFFNCQLFEFPREVGELHNLKFLDLRCVCRNTENIEVVLLSKLDQLEVLYMGGYTISKIKELNSLSCLTTLQIFVSNLNILLELEESFFDKLKRFDISIGRLSFYSGPYGIIRNQISMRNDDLSWFLSTKLHYLARKTQRFDFQYCDGDQFIMHQKLELLSMEGTSSLTEIGLCSKTQDGSSHRLQEVSLENLPKLKHLWRGPVQPSSLANLRYIRIEYCLSIEYLFQPSVAKCMVQLERLVIGECPELKGVISNQRTEGYNEFSKIVFPKLESIGLVLLPCFKSFYLESVNENLEGDCGSMQYLFNQQVSFPNLEHVQFRGIKSPKRVMDYQMQDGPTNNLRSIRVSSCENLNICVDSTSLQNLEKVEIYWCESMEAVFDLKELKVERGVSPFIFDKLESIDLERLHNLTHVWRMVVPDGIQGFRNLKTLKLQYCKKLRYLMSCLVAKMLVNLQCLELVHCDEIVGVIEAGEEEERSNEIIVFPQLRLVKLFYLTRFKSFCSSRKFCFELPVLGEVDAYECPEMNMFCGGVLKAPFLKGSNAELWIWE